MENSSRPGFVADIGGTNMRLALVARDGGAFREIRSKTPSLPTPERVLDRLAEMMSALGGGEQATGLVLGIPGLVDAETGVVRINANLGWRNVALADAARQRLGLATMIQNDVRLHTLGEWRFGAGRELTPRQTMADVVIGTGIAMGLVSGGQLLNTPESGEIGHITWDRQGIRCGCGKTGCVETMVGAKALIRLFREQGLPADDFAHDVVGSLRAGRPESVRLWNQFSRALAFGLSVVVMVVHPDLIVLSGGVGQSFGWWRPMLMKALQDELFSDSLSGVRITTSALADRAPYLGGLTLLSETSPPR